MSDDIQKTLAAIRMHLDLPANLHGTAIRLLRKFDPMRMERLQQSIREYRARTGVRSCPLTNSSRSCRNTGLIHAS